MTFARRPHHVDDDAAAACFHRGQDGAGQFHVAEHLEVPTMPPSGAVDPGQGARRNVAGVVDQDIDVAARRAQRRDRLRPRQVADVDRRLDAVGAFHLIGDGAQAFFAAGREVQIAAFGGETLGDGFADPARGAGDQRRAPTNVEIHVSSSPSLTVNPSAARVCPLPRAMALENPPL
jgi:hypothetical protein